MLLLVPAPSLAFLWLMWAPSHRPSLQYLEARPGTKMPVVPAPHSGTFPSLLGIILTSEGDPVPSCGKFGREAGMRLEAGARGCSAGPGPGEQLSVSTHGSGLNLESRVVAEPKVSH